MDIITHGMAASCVRDRDFVDDQRRIESEWEDEDGWNRPRGVFISLVLSR